MLPPRGWGTLDTIPIEAGGRLRGCSAFDSRAIFYLWSKDCGRGAFQRRRTEAQSSHHSKLLEVLATAEPCQASNLGCFLMFLGIELYLKRNHLALVLILELSLSLLSITLQYSNYRKLNTESSPPITTFLSFVICILSARTCLWLSVCSNLLWLLSCV